MRSKFEKSQSFKYVSHPQRIEFGLFDRSYYAVLGYLKARILCRSVQYKGQFPSNSLFFRSGTSALEHALILLKRNNSISRVAFSSLNCVNVVKAVLAVDLEPIILEPNEDLSTDYHNAVDDSTAVLFTHPLGDYELESMQRRFPFVINDLSQVNYDESLLSNAVDNSDYVIFSTGDMKPTGSILGGVLIGHDVKPNNHNKKKKVHVNTHLYRWLCRQYSLRSNIGFVSSRAVKRKCRFVYKEDEYFDFSPEPYDLEESQSLESFLSYFEFLRKKNYLITKFQRKQIENFFRNQNFNYIESQYAIPNYFTLVMNSTAERIRYGEELAKRNVEVTWNYIPLTYYKQFSSYRFGAESSDAWKKVLSIPYIDFSSKNNLMDLYNEVFI